MKKKNYNQYPQYKMTPEQWTRVKLDDDTIEELGNMFVDLEFGSKYRIYFEQFVQLYLTNRWEKYTREHNIYPFPKHRIRPRQSIVSKK